MRRIFTATPYFLPAEPEPLLKLFRASGTPRSVKKGELLKRGGDAQKLFLLESGLCAYYAAEALNHRPSILSVLLPGRVMGDMTASIRTRCNVFTKALVDSKVLVIPPEVLACAIERDPTLAQIEIRNVVAKEESIIEGMAANFLRSPKERVLAFTKALCLVMGVEADENGWYGVPVTFSAALVGEVVNLNRVSVARIISQWALQGFMLRKGRRLFVHQRLFDAVDDWMDNRVPADMP